MNLYLFKNEKFIVYLFLFLFVATLAPVWGFPYFVTGDGPCHLYNASILHKWLNGHGQYFHRFYSFNAALFPNWFTHTLMVGLLYIFPTEIVHKITISLCLFCFAYGFRYYIGSFAARQHWLALFVFPFLWQMVMLMGFYNYMFSIGTCFFLLGYLQLHYHSFKLKHITVLMLLSIAVFFMHLFGVLLLLLGSLFFVLAKVVAPVRFTRTLKVVPAIAPAVLLSIHYLMPTDTDNIERFRSTYTHFFGISHIQHIGGTEWVLAALISLAIWLLVGLASWLALSSRVGVARECVVPLGLLVLAIGYYFVGPAWAFGGGYMLERVQILAYLFAIAFVAAVPLPPLVGRISIPFASLVALLFISFRLTCFGILSDIVVELKTLSPMIKNESVVLPLTYITAPQKDGKYIFKDVGLLAHCMEAISVEKDFVYLENYEANTGYFPLLWQENMNPFKPLSLGFGIENTPPEAALNNYNATHSRIDYIVTLGDKVASTDNSEPGKLSKMIDEHYQRIYTTPIHLISLYKYKE